MDNNSKKDYWHHHLEECDKSDLSQIEYCAINKIALSTFGYWKRRLRRGDDHKPVFYPLAVASAPAFRNNDKKSSLILHLKKGRFSIEIEKGFSASTLSEVISTLEQL